MWGVLISTALVSTVVGRQTSHYKGAEASQIPLKSCCKDLSFTCNKSPARPAHPKVARIGSEYPRPPPHLLRNSNRMQRATASAAAFCRSAKGSTTFVRHSSTSFLTVRVPHGRRKQNKSLQRSMNSSSDVADAFTPSPDHALLRCARRFMLD